MFCIRSYCLFIRYSVFSLLISCAGPNNDSKNMTPDIDTLIIVNQTNSILQDVKLKDFETQTYVSCSEIPPKTECSLRFKRINAERHVAILNWRQGSNTYSQKVQAQNPIPTNELFKVYVEIFDNGELDTYFRKR